MRGAGWRGRWSATGRSSPWSRAAAGGVVVAYEVARALGAPLDVLIVRKIGVPGAEEFAMGATAAGSTLVDADLVGACASLPPWWT